LREGAHGRKTQALREGAHGWKTQALREGAHGRNVDPKEQEERKPGELFLAPQL
jgi:hypothetical protein